MITNKMEGAIIVIFIIMALGNFLSIYFIFKSTIPYLESGNRNGDYCSVIYFNSIAEVDCEEYLSKIDILDDKVLEKDLIRQIHVLSTGLRNKMQGLKYAFNFTLWMVLLPLLIVSLVLLFQALFS
ncbi:MAG: Pycsar system effector family protein [Halanaerobiales bacterium]